MPFINLHIKILCSPEEADEVMRELSNKTMAGRYNRHSILNTRILRAVIKRENNWCVKGMTATRNDHAIHNNTPYPSPTMRPTQYGSDINVDIEIDMEYV